MTLGESLGIASTFVVAFGVLFAALQFRNDARQRREQVAIEIVHQMEVAGARGDQIFALPVACDPAEIRQRGLEPLAQEICIRWETLGLLVYRRVVSIDFVEELMGLGVVMMWLRLAPFVENQRRIIGSPAAFEWFQWLAERLAERAPDKKSVPAYIAHRDWKA